MAQFDSYIWFSYAPEDASRVMPIARQMQADGFRCRLPQDDPHGLAQCGYCFVFLSESYLSHRDCLEALNTARSSEKPLLLLYLEDVTLPHGIAMRIGRNQAIFCSRYPDRAALMDKLYEAQNIEQFSENAIPAASAAPATAKKRSAVLMLLPLLLALCLGLFLWRLPMDDRALLQNDSLRLTIKELTAANGQVTMTVTAENRTNQGLVLTAEDCFLNGITNDPQWICVLNPKQKLDTTIQWQADSISAAEFTLRCTDTKGEEMFAPVPVAHYPKGEAAFVPPVYSPAADDILLGSSGDLTMYSGQPQYDERTETWVFPLTIVSSGTADRNVSLSDTQLNGWGIAADLQVHVPAQRIVRTHLRLSRDQWLPLSADGTQCFSGTVTAGSRISSFDFSWEAPWLTAPMLPDMTACPVAYEDETIRVLWLGTREEGHMFCVENCTQNRQAVTFFSRTFPRNDAYSYDLYLPALGKTLLYVQQDGPLPDDYYFELTFQTLNYTLNMYEWSSPVIFSPHQINQ